MTLFEKYTPVVKAYRFPLIAGGFGIIFFVIGLASVFFQNNSSDEIIFEKGSEHEERQTETALFVDIQGAVLKPGVYSFSSKDPRLQDALVAAGGLSDQADRDWIAKQLNLASKLKDGMKLYIPSVHENQSQASLTLLNLNTAAMSQLEELPGIGSKTAEKIIQERPFTSIDELVEKKLVSEKTYEKIKEKITVY